MKLDPRYHAILDVIAEANRSGQPSPTYRAMAQAVGLSSSAFYWRLCQLVKQGYVTRMEVKSCGTLRINIARLRRRRGRKSIRVYRQVDMRL